MKASLSTVLILAASLGVAGCRRGDAVRADHGWVRLSPVPGHPAAAYLTLHGGAVPAELVAIDSRAAGSTELHESLMRYGAAGQPPTMSMDRVDVVPVPAHGAVALAPGGYHLMMFGLSPALKPGDRVPLTLRFAKGPAVTVAAKVVGAGDAAPY